MHHTPSVPPCLCSASYAQGKNLKLFVHVHAHTHTHTHTPLILSFIPNVNNTLLSILYLSALCILEKQGMKKGKKGRCGDMDTFGSN